MDEEIVIWPHHRAFYIESMLSITSSAVASTERLAIIFDPNANLDDLRQKEILDWIQNIFTQAAALSRYFWAVKEEKLHKKRSQYLRKVFNVSEQSSIKNRDLRNMIEHFDESLDYFVNQPVVGNIVPNYIGLEPEVNGVPFHTFRAFYTRIGVFEVLGQRFELQPVVDEIYEVHRKLLTIAESGYDFRISTK
jgi:hypothetical protein